jgi:tetratricopeptide (TPR) repeat protein
VEELERRNSRILRALPVGFPLLLGAAVAGAGFLWLRRREGVGANPPPEGQAAVSLLLGLFALVYFLSFLPYVAAGQYRVPVIPVLAVLAGVAAAGIGALARAGRRREAAAWALALLAAWGGASVNFAGYEVRPWLWHMGRADSAATSGDTALAEREYRAAIALAPNRDILHFGLGVVLARAGRLEEAAGEFRRTLELNPSHAKASFNLGMALFWQGQLAESRPHFERAIAIKPDYAEARQRLAAVNTLLGRR